MEFVRLECKTLQKDQDKMKDPFKYIETLHGLDKDLQEMNETCFHNNYSFQ